MTYILPIIVFIGAIVTTISVIGGNRWIALASVVTSLILWAPVVIFTITYGDSWVSFISILNILMMTVVALILVYDIRKKG